MVVRVSFNEPLSKGKKFDWSIIFVKGKSLSREGVVFGLILFLVVTDNKVIWVVIWVWTEVKENSFFFTL